jgi:HPt (histidine-containing phosphotransfer) domain-containing protein
MPSANDTTKKGRPLAALFGTRAPVPRATLTQWARRLEQESPWAHPALLVGDAHRLLRALGTHGVPLLATERAQWEGLARRVERAAQEQLDKDLRAVFRARQSPTNTDGMEAYPSNSDPLGT